MISSAVVIPEQEVESHPASPSTLKRRQPSVSSDSSKRPRLETRTSSNNGISSINGGAMSPPSRRKSALGVGAAEDKKRGQRLFGALLGTLSQTSSKPAHRKRDEIEQRQRERIRQDTKEREDEKRRKREELDKSRRVEQKAWEKEGMTLRHRNMRAMACFLQTRTEPRLYYKPWELREEDEEQIKRQKTEVESKIRAELGQDGEDASMQVDDDKAMQDQARDDNDSNDDKHDKPGEKSHVNEEQPQVDTGVQAGPKSVSETNEHGTPTAERKPAEDDRNKDDDHAGEELVEGQEDDVIY